MAVKNLQFVLSGKDKSASQSLDKVGKKADGLTSKLSKMGGLLAGGAVAAGAVSFARSSVDAFKEAEKSAAELAFAFEKFPKLADSNAEAFSKLNEELAKKTRFDDDATASGQAVLAQFGLTGKEILKVTPLLQDYAAKTGKDLPEAAADLGKAFDGNARALKPLGIQYKSTGDKAKDFENVQKLLNDKVGGFAAKEGATAAGQAEILGNKFGELKETVGAQLMPVIASMVDYLSTTVVPALQKFADQFAAGEGAGGKFRDVLKNMGDIARDAWPHVETLAKFTGELIEWFAAHPTAVTVVAAGFASYAASMKILAALNLVKLAAGLLGVNAAMAGGGAAAAGGAAGAASSMDKIGKVARYAGVGGVIGYGAGTLDAEFNRRRNGGSDTETYDGGDGYIYTRNYRTGELTRKKKPTAPKFIPKAAPGGSTQDRAGTQNRTTSTTYPRNGQTAGNLVVNIDGKSAASATSAIVQGRMARGFVAAY